MKNSFVILRKLNIVEWLLIIISFALIICSYVIAPFFGGDRSLVSMITSLIGIIGIVFIAHGNVAAHYIYIIYSILYTILSILSAYYGEAIIYFFLMLPIHIMSIISWNKYLDNQNGAKSVEINDSYKSMLIIVGLGIVLTVPFYFLLKILNTDNLLFSTLSFGMSLVAAVLMLMRNKFFSLAFAVDDIFSVLLWGAKIFNGTYKYIPTLIVCVVALINDIYSFAKWCLRFKAQKRGGKHHESK